MASSALAPGRSRPPGVAVPAAGLARGKMPVLPPAAAGRASVLQRYPVTASGNAIVATQGRPTAKSNKGTIEAIVKDIFTSMPKNDYETLLHKMGTQTKAVDAIYNNNFLSTNSAAICHKMAIDTVEQQVVAYANHVLNKTNTAQIDSEMTELVKSLTSGSTTIQQNALAYLTGIQKAPQCGLFTTPAVDAAQHCNDLIHTIDGSATNLYIGNGRTNSSVQTNFDAHYDVSDPTDLSNVNATPRSTSIYTSQHTVSGSMGMVPNSPYRAHDQVGDWVKTSSVPDIGWVTIDKNKSNI